MSRYETNSGYSIATVDEDASLHVQRVSNVIYLDVVNVAASSEDVADENIVVSIQLTREQADALRDALL